MRQLITAAFLCLVLAGCTSNNSNVPLSNAGKWQLYNNPNGVQGAKLAILPSVDKSSGLISVLRLPAEEYTIDFVGTPLTGSSEPRIALAIDIKKASTCRPLLSIGGDEYSAEVKDRGGWCQYIIDRSPSQDSRVLYITEQLAKSAAVYVNGVEFDAYGLGEVMSKL